MRTIRELVRLGRQESMTSIINRDHALLHSPTRQQITPGCGVPHLTGVVRCFVAAVLQQHTCGTEHGQTCLCGEGRILCCSLALQLHITALRDSLLKEAVKMVQHGYPVVDVSLWTASGCNRKHKQA